MPGRRARVLRGVVLGGAALARAAAASYPLTWRYWCLTWGATPDEVAMNLPGDELLPDAAVVSTRAIEIGASPAEVWPWLAQMGSGRAGAYSYDWIENLLGLDMHSADVILPQFQDIHAGDEFPLGRRGGRLRVEVCEPGRALVLRRTTGDWVWIATLLPDEGLTRLVSRNRIAPPRGHTFSRVLCPLVAEPGSLVMERKTLLGIRDRAQRLARLHPRVPA